MRESVLAEYTPIEIDLSGATVDQLVKRHRKHLGLAPLGNGRWQVSPTSYVGTIATPDHVFLIRPKASLHNLLAMMDIAIPSETWRRDVANLATEPDLLSVMARLFCVACEDTTRRGIRRSYVRHAERLVSPRGRIDVSEIVRRPGIPVPVPCRFDEHTPDIPINQILKAAIESARRLSGLPPSWKHRLGIQLSELEDVSGQMRDTAWVNRWDAAPMERHYTTSVRLAHLILSESSLRDELGETSSNTFLLNMNDLFEKWVAVRLSEQIGTIRLEQQHRSFLSDQDQVLLKPDITLWRGDRCIAIADTKYKLLGDDGHGQASDHYQALAYATAYDIPEAWLIYARIEGDSAGSEVAVRWTDKTIHTIGLDLTGPIDDAVTQLRLLATRLASERFSQSPGRLGAL